MFLDLTRAQSHPELRPGLRLDLIKDLRVRVSMCTRAPYFNPRTCLDLGMVCAQMSDLEVVEISFSTCQPRALQSRLLESALMYGLVAQILDSVPGRVSVQWKMWTGLKLPACWHGVIDRTSDLDVDGLQAIAARVCGTPRQPNGRVYEYKSESDAG